MARPLRITYPGAFYHITSRGNEHKPVFKGNRDREKLFEYPQSTALRYRAVIHAYRLMNNHCHLMLETPDGNLPPIMRHINGAYTTYFNVKRSRAGHLFQGCYKAISIDTENYAKELSRYIHLNPVRAEMVKKPEDYQWSSHQDHTGGRKPALWLNRDVILGYFGGKESIAQTTHKAFVTRLVDAEYETPLRDVFTSTILGCPDFVAHAKETYVKCRQPDRNVPATKHLPDSASVQDIFEGVDRLGLDGRLARNIQVKSSKKSGIGLI